jgi:hypothetical protein
MAKRRAKRAQSGWLVLFQLTKRLLRATN